LFLVFVVERTAHRTYAVEFRFRVFGFSFYACVNRLPPQYRSEASFQIFKQMLRE